jgi:hypothetical protein
LEAKRHVTNKIRISPARITAVFPGVQFAVSVLMQWFGLNCAVCLEEAVGGSGVLFYGGLDVVLTSDRLKRRGIQFGQFILTQVWGRGK